MTRERKIVREYDELAAARLQGQIRALEFSLETAKNQIEREQKRLAKLAIAATGVGVQLADVFDECEADHVRRCVRTHEYRTQDQP